MNRIIWTRILIPMLVGFGGTFLLIYFMFETLGVTEYVWPILFPILGTTFGIMIIAFVILGIAVSKSQRNRIPIDTEMVAPTYRQPMYRTGDYSDGAVYTVPMYCPHCKYKIEMDQVEWVSPTELTCSNCFMNVRIGVRESI
ncbi:MAG: hypothetical protein ACFFCP_07160 [Promethearchaeota archaeon]